MNILLFVIICMCIVNIFSERSLHARSLMENIDEDFERQKKAIKQWSNELTDTDLNINGLENITHPFAPQRYFNLYSKKLSDTFLANNAMLNFLLVGACDGTSDLTIKKLYWPNQHWQGVFVEPISMNFNDLIKNFHKEGINTHSRSILIQAAVTQECPTANISLRVPNFEHLTPNAPHWKRRQIASIIDAENSQKIGKQLNVLVQLLLLLRMYLY